MFTGLVITVTVAVFITFGIGLVGIPFAVRLARPQVWESNQLRPAVNEPIVTTGPSFVPLELGPDPVLWPSEVERPVTAQKELPWPSQTWDDPHFGRHWREHGSGQAADAAWEANQAARRAQQAQVRKDSAQRHQQRQERSQQQASQGPPANPVQRRARQEMRQIREQAAAMQQQARQQVGQQADHLGAQAREHARRVAAEKANQLVPGASEALAKVPPQAELERLVNEVGLAGTVQEIMKRTGWDFKTAAQHLARARRGR